MLPPAKFITLSIAAAVILSGCGGSADNGSTAPTTIDPLPTGPSVSAPEVTSGAFAGAQVLSGMFQSQLLDFPMVTKFEGDGAGGFDITYRIDGTDQTIRFAESDYGANPEEDFDSYYKQLGNWIYTVESETSREPPLGDSEFDHFDIYFAEVFESSDDASIILDVSVGYFVHGTPTRTLPAGTAEYSGRFRAKLIAPVSLPPTTPSSGWLRSSNLTLTLDFTDNTVNGAIDGIETRLRGQRSYEPVAGRFTIDGMIAESASGSGLRADMTGTEDLATWDVDMEGRVFGPQAAEVGGVLTGTNSADDHRLIGYFGAATQ